MSSYAKFALAVVAVVLHNKTTTATTNIRTFIPETRGSLELAR